jgi:hypothetical protein
MTKLSLALAAACFAAREGSVILRNHEFDSAWMALRFVWNRGH